MQNNSATGQASLTNRSMRLTLNMPGQGANPYRGTRFDWSGVIASLQWEGNTYFGRWFERMDPNIHDFTYDPSGIVAGPCTAVTGPVEEFTAALGYQNAPAGGSFVKIGVGVLRKPRDAPYDSFHLYEIKDPGQWHVSRRPDAVQFEQEVSDPSSGFAYQYQKTIEISGHEPVLTIEHTLKNTGKRAIETDVYDHNFLVMDDKAPGRNLTIRVPFQIVPVHAPEKDLAEVSGNHIHLLRDLEGQDRVYGSFKGFGSSSDDYDIRIENTQLETGLRITGDRPLSNMAVWAIRSVFAVEPFIRLSVDPGQSVTWRYRYTFYKLNSSGQ